MFHKTFSRKFYIYQIVHGTKGHMSVYESECHPQNIIWSEAKLKSIYYFVGDRAVHFPFAPKSFYVFSEFS